MYGLSTETNIYSDQFVNCNGSTFKCLIYNHYKIKLQKLILYFSKFK